MIWILIAKGDRRPEGRVLVTYFWEDKIEAMMKGGEPEWFARVVIARWSTRKTRWLDDSGRSLDNVIAWMELPEPSEEGPWNILLEDKEISA